MFWGVPVAGTVQTKQSGESGVAEGAPAAGRGTAMKLYVGCAFSGIGTAMTCSMMIKTASATLVHWEPNMKASIGTYQGRPMTGRSQRCLILH